MESAEVTAIAEMFFPQILAFFGVAHFDIKIYVERIDGDGTTVARVRLFDGYQQGSLIIDPSAVRNRDSLLDVLAHEAFHVVVNPLQEVTDALAGPNCTSFVDSMVKIGLERTICNLEKIWQSALRHQFVANTNYYERAERAASIGVVIEEICRGDHEVPDILPDGGGASVPIAEPVVDRPERKPKPKRVRPSKRGKGTGKS